MPLSILGASSAEFAIGARGTMRCPTYDAFWGYKRVVCARNPPGPFHSSSRILPALTRCLRDPSGFWRP
jgi:hypothetical protein